MGRTTSLPTRPSTARIRGRTHGNGLKFTYTGKVHGQTLASHSNSHAYHTFPHTSPLSQPQNLHWPSPSILLISPAPSLVLSRHSTLPDIYPVYYSCTTVPRLDPLHLVCNGNILPWTRCVAHPAVCMRTMNLSPLDSALFLVFLIVGGIRWNARTLVNHSACFHVPTHAQVQLLSSPLPTSYIYTRTPFPSFIVC